MYTVAISLLCGLSLDVYAKPHVNSFNTLKCEPEEYLSNI